MDWRKRMRVEGQYAQRAEFWPSRAAQVIQLGERLWHAYDADGREIGAFASHDEARAALRR
jgi:hypothetical protein